MSLLAHSVLPQDKPQIISTRLIAAPRELVWKVLTSPEHLKHFWGPDGFTNSYRQFDLKVGGQALFTMHGPDGTDYPNRFIFLDVKPPQLLRFEHDGGEDGAPGHRFLNEIELRDEAGKTRMEMRLTTADIATRDQLATFAVEGGLQNLDRVAAYVAPMAAEKNLFVIERSFPVSVERLYQACTEEGDLKHWMAPAGAKVIITSRDFRPGGICLYGNVMPNGVEMWGRQTFKEITPNTRLVYRQSFADKEGNLAAHPMAPSWPKEMLTVMDFIAEGPKQARLRVSWIYTGVDDAEAATFHAAHAGMTGGWTGSLNALHSYLTKGE
ncbi:MAG: SRPBCC domain-containing protein [Alphaproteobacteria bacterium]|nr:SRPBCC domain-containing protein [Alphaproteobacteria bacterium]